MQQNLTIAVILVFTFVVWLGIITFGMRLVNIYARKLTEAREAIRAERDGEGASVAGGSGAAASAAAGSGAAGSAAGDANV